jgi:hypothetical protein
MTLKPTPFTAAFAGVIATLLVIALPAHVFVMGLGRAQEESNGSPVNMALLKRIGAWLAAGVGTAVLRPLAGL